MTLNRTSRNRDVLIDPGNKSGFSLLFRFGTFEKYVSINFRLPENVTGIYFAKVFVIQIFELTQLISNGYSIGHPPFCETGSECNYIHSMSDSRVSMRLGVNLFHH